MLHGQDSRPLRWTAECHLTAGDKRSGHTEAEGTQKQTPAPGLNPWPASSTAVLDGEGPPQGSEQGTLLVDRAATTTVDGVTQHRWWQRRPSWLARSCCAGCTHRAALLGMLGRLWNRSTTEAGTSGESSRRGIGAQTLNRHPLWGTCR